MSWGLALYRLLRRPAAYSWVPLAVAASMASTWLAAVVLFVVGDIPGSGPIPSIYISFATLIGILVGQAVRELLHCPFSWGLPGLRRRLLPGALAVGLVVTLFAREIFTAVLAVFLLIAGLFFRVSSGAGDVWRSFPPFSLGLAAVTFMTFWIGVRPSVLNVVFVLLPVAAVSPWLFPWVSEHALSTIVVTAPLTVFLVRQTFGVAAARRQPFLFTRPLSGAAWSRGTTKVRSTGAQRARRTRRRGAVWGTTPLGNSTRRWIYAGWYENHGAAGRLVGALTVLIPAGAIAMFTGYLVATMFAAPSLWFTEGFGRWFLVPSSVVMAMRSIVIGSSILGIPLAVLALAYGSISLRRAVLYPRPRSELATVEYFGSLAETAVVTGLITAFLAGSWMVLVFLDYGFGGFDRWPPQVGREYGWLLALMRVLAAIVIAAPLVQYYRLCHIRAPQSPSPVAQLLTVFLLSAVITAAATMLALGSLRSLARQPLIVHVAIFATAALMTQYLYRRSLERYFARADLV
jgi:hypothetical protein